MPSSNPLTERDCAKLIAILGMLGSDADGECVSAARHTIRFLKERGLTFADLIRPVAKATASQPPHVHGAIYSTYLIFARKHVAALSEKEAALVLTLESWNGTPPTNHVKRLFSICARLRRGGAQ